MVVTGGTKTANKGPRRGCKWEQKWREPEGNQVCTEGNGKEPFGEKKAKNVGD